MRSWFDMIQDKFNSPYFTDLEFEEFINQGQLNFVNEVLFGQFIPATAQVDRGGQVMNPAEASLQGSEIIRPLIVPDLSVNSSIAGAVTNNDIDTALSASTAIANQKHMHLLSVILNDAGTDRLCRFVRHNDYVKFKTNSFKRPTATAPVYRVFRDGIKLDPEGVRNYKITVVKRPVNVSLSGNVNCELPAEYHGLVVAYAINLASVSSRDEALAVLMNRSTGNAQQ